MKSNQRTENPEARASQGRNEGKSFLVEPPKDLARANDGQIDFLHRLFPEDILPENWLNRWMEWYLNLEDSGESVLDPYCQEWARRINELSDANEIDTYLSRQSRTDRATEWIDWYKEEED